MSLKTKCLMSGLDFALVGKDFSSSSFDKLYPRKWVHPIFSITARASLDLIRQVFADPDKFTATETYLIGLTVISHTGLVEFSSPPKTGLLIRDGNTITPASIVVQKSADLIRIATFIAALGDSTRQKLPTFRLTSEVSVIEFIENFIETIYDWKCERETNNEKERTRIALEVAESSLRKAIEKYGQDSTYVASRLAAWAAKSACFPEFTIINPLSASGVKIKLSDYWREIIIRCVDEKKIFSVPTKDITELLEHCLQYLSAKDYMFHKLIGHIERGLERASSYLDGGDTSYNVAHKSFAILSDETTQETAVNIAMIMQAPDVEPFQEDYPTKLDYMKAKARWIKKQEYEKSGKSLDQLSGISAAVEAKKLNQIDISDL